MVDGMRTIHNGTIIPGTRFWQQRIKLQAVMVNNGVKKRKGVPNDP
jgi:hypothetical protein